MIQILILTLTLPTRHKNPSSPTHWAWEDALDHIEPERQGSSDACLWFKASTSVAMTNVTEAC